MKKKQMIRRIGCALLLLLWIGFIFGNSLNDADASSAKSGFVMQLVNRVLGIVHLGPLSEFAIRKIAHFGEFLIEGILLVGCLSAFWRNWTRQLAIPPLCGILTAMTDETIQMFSEGRACLVTDVWIDSAGAAAGIFLAAAVCVLIERKRRGTARMRNKKNRMPA